MNVPYISITDFMTPAQVRNVLNSITLLPGTKLGVGVMMSYKTLNRIKTRFSEVFPPTDKVKDIFIDDPRVFNTLHYADYRGVDVYENLSAACLYSGDNLHAIQLDMTWPDPLEIRKFHTLFPDIKIILQIGRKAFDQVDNDYHKLIAKLAEYNEALDYVLLDKSMGKGKGLDADFMLPFLYMLNKERPDLGLVVAGGLGPNSLYLIAKIIELYPNVSIDAQGQLRNSGSFFDPIDWGRANLYVQRANDMFAQVRSK